MTEPGAVTAAFAEVPDAHTYVGRRDALDPNLVDLLARAWGNA